MSLEKSIQELTAQITILNANYAELRGRGGEQLADTTKVETKGDAEQIGELDGEPVLSAVDVAKAKKAQAAKDRRAKLKAEKEAADALAAESGTENSIAESESTGAAESGISVEDLAKAATDFLALPCVKDLPASETTVKLKQIATEHGAARIREVVPSMREHCLDAIKNLTADALAASDNTDGDVI